MRMIPRGPAWHADVSLPWVAGSLVKEAARSCWKCKTNLMGFLRIATGPTYVSYNFIQGSSGPVGAKGNVGSPGPSGKKVSGISLRCQIWRKKYLPSFLDFHVNSSHDPGTINHPPAFC